MGRKEQKQRIEGQTESKRKKEDQETSLGLASTLMWRGSVGTVRRIQPSVRPRLLDGTAFGTPKLVGHNKNPHRVAHVVQSCAHLVLAWHVVVGHFSRPLRHRSVANLLVDRHPPRRMQPSLANTATKRAFDWSIAWIRRAADPCTALFRFSVQSYVFGRKK